MSSTQFLRSRRSIRKFTSEAIPAEILREILETACYAPSAHGLQPWRFVIVESSAARESLGQALTEQMRRDMQAESAPEAEIAQRVSRSLQRIAEAPLILLLCRDSEAVRVHAPEEDLMAIQSVAMAGLQLMLAAHAQGLGANWICWPLYAQQATQQTLTLPQNWQPQGMVFLGAAAEEAKPKELLPLESLLLTR
ncbi:MAG: nitroreductase family protein [Anaerolineales bacterium]